MRWSEMIQREKGDSLAKRYVDKHLFQALV
ncbi:hypothetical protein Goshw_013190 [Gossypium schwendimanii]|uniref:Uncharacterized protein n=1 Tax=Gossypium schwendimanii TaxID=34291 RepID=A0A7J9N413_GOSSC|nr:hypothetical protein [Gossypium schwendimanii]